MNSTIQIISCVLGITLALGGIVSLFAYSRAQWLKGTNDALRENNTDLSALLETTKAKLVSMDCDLKNAIKEIGELRGQVKMLSQQKGALEDLVSRALAEYFQNNPKIAESLKK